MYEAYAAMLVGVISAAAAIGALISTRRLSPLGYTAVHLSVTLLMIGLVTFGYARIPLSARTSPDYVSRLIYLGASCATFFNTMLIHAILNRPKGERLVDLFSIGL